jgi:hypothetical protein
VLNITDSKGSAAITQADMFIGNNLGGTNQCYIDYSPSTKILSLLASDNSKWSSGVIGSQTTLKNNQCAINLAGVTAAASTYTLSLSIPVTFNVSSFAGTQTILTFAADSGTSTGWQKSGTWTVQ